MLTALIVIGILVFLIIAHEFGHFIAAKLSGVQVDEFGIGYPPRAFSLGKWGETEYTLNWLPFGGFVRLFGEEGLREASGKPPKKSLVGANRAVQAAILVAGVTMNALAAWVLFTSAFYFGTPRPVESTGASTAIELIVTEVVQGSPAEAAGIKAGDRILRIESVRDKTTAELTPNGVPRFVADRGGQTLDIRYVRGGQPRDAQVQPANGVIEGEAGRAALGIRLSLIDNQPLTITEAAKAGFSYTIDAFKRVSAGLWVIISGAFQGNAPLKEVVGPVGLVSVAGDAARHGVGNILALAAFISVNLAIINLLPLPALDGGRLVVIGVEALRRRPIPHAIISLVNGAGFALIILLMLVVTYNDIARLLV